MSKRLSTRGMLASNPASTVAAGPNDLNPGLHTSHCKSYQVKHSRELSELEEVKFKLIGSVCSNMHVE